MAVPQTYFDHPSLEPDLAETITRQNYIDFGLVKYAYTLETDKISDKILQLTEDLKVFDERIKNYDGDTSSFPDISKKN